MSKIRISKLTLSDFAQKEVVRSGEKAEVVFDYYGPLKKPVRLLGFETEAWKKDFDVREEAYHHWLDMVYNYSIGED